MEVDMWTVGGGIPDPGAENPVAVALIGAIAALAVLVALVARAVQGRRREDGPRSGYS
jgi:hypothetical protein